MVLPWITLKGRWLPGCKHWERIYLVTSQPIACPNEAFYTLPPEAAWYSGPDRIYYIYIHTYTYIRVDVSQFFFFLGTPRKVLSGSTGGSWTFLYFLRLDMEHGEIWTRGPKPMRLPSSSVKALLLHWATGKRSTSRLPNLSLITKARTFVSFFFFWTSWLQVLQGMCTKFYANVRRSEYGGSMSSHS